jgi:type I restriction enzyme, S subunit
MGGFQETEVGRFPKDWEMSKIDDVFSLQQGKSLSAKERTGEFLRPFLRTSNVFWGQMDLQTVDEMDIPPKDRERLALRHGDVLVCEGGDI